MTVSNKVNSQIAALYEEGLTQTEIGDLFGLSQNRVSEILKILGISVSDKINISRIHIRRPG